MGKILIIDDELVILKAASQILDRYGYDVLVADSGNEGIGLCRQEEIDLVVTDVIMPDKEGLEVIMEIREAFPDIKIIAMSGGGYVDGEQCLDLAQKLGADSILSKPFTVEELLGAINEAFNKSQVLPPSGNSSRSICTHQ